MQRKSGGKVSKEQSTMRAAETLSLGGRVGDAELKEIASMSVVDLLQSGLTLEQVETVMKMAAIEASRIVGESQLQPKIPAIDVKIKKGARK